MYRCVVCSLFVLALLQQTLSIDVKRAEVAGDIAQIVVPTETDVLLLTSDHFIYKSTDGGATVAKIDPSGGSGTGDIVRIVTTPSNPSHLLFFDCESSIYVSKTMGSSFTKLETPGVLNGYLPHEKTAEVGISTIGDVNSCDMSLYHTQDLGLSWELVATSVCEADWAQTSDPNSDRIIVIVEEAGTRYARWIESYETIIKSVDQITGYFQNEGATLLWTEGGQILISFEDSLSFTEVESTLPADSIKEMRFMSGHEGEILGTLTIGSQGVHEDVGTRWTEVFKLTGKGDAMIESLQNVYRPEAGSTAFFTVPALGGVVLANQISNPGAVLDVGALPVLVTKISLDFGASWTNLVCPTGAGALNLKIIPEGVIPGIVGSQYTAGFVAAVGNCGNHLKSDVSEMNTYYSVDGGQTWNLGAIGAYVLALGNYGGVVAMMPADGGTEVKYTTNYFETVGEVTFTSTATKEAQFTSEETSMKFVAVGSGEVIAVDFSSVFSSQCGQTDFQSFVLLPDGSACLMGKAWNVTKRKSGSKCKMTTSPIGPQTSQCSCGYVDYECDVGFKRAGNKNDSVFDCNSINPAYYKGFQSVCIPMMNAYYVTGFSKIVGDGCEGALDLNSSSRPCNIFSNYILIVIIIAAILYTIVMAIVVGGFGWYWFTKTVRGMEMWDTVADLARKSNASYSQLFDGTRLGGGPVVQGDEEMTTLENKDN